MKTIIAGSRNFNDYGLLEAICNDCGNISEIVSGTAKGADSLGERYGKEYKIPIKRFPADWNKFGKKAGYLRNKKMAEYADACIVFWDGESKGTKLMIDLAHRNSLFINIIRFDLEDNI